MIDIGCQTIFVNAVMLRQPVRDYLAAIGRRVAVNLGSVAGRYDDRLVYRWYILQFSQGNRHPLGRKRDFLANVDWSR